MLILNETATTRAANLAVAVKVWLDTNETPGATVTAEGHTVTVTGTDPLARIEATTCEGESVDLEFLPFTLIEGRGDGEADDSDCGDDLNALARRIADMFDGRVEDIAEAKAEALEAARTHLAECLEVAKGWNWDVVETQAAELIGREGDDPELDDLLRDSILNTGGVRAAARAGLVLQHPDDHEDNQPVFVSIMVTSGGDEGDEYTATVERGGESFPHEFHASTAGLSYRLQQLAPDMDEAEPSALAVGN